MACKGATLVLKHKAPKAQELLDKASLQDKIEIAQVCSQVSDRETYDVLATLIRENQRDLQLACVLSFGKNADPRAIVHLQWLRERVPAEDKEMLDAISAAIISSRGGKVR